MYISKQDLLDLITQIETDTFSFEEELSHTSQLSPGDLRTGEISPPVPMMIYDHKPRVVRKFTITTSG